MGYCDECRDETRWLTVSQAAQLVQRSERTIYYWIERGFLHIRILPSGRGRRICERSLLQRPMEEDE